MTSIRIAGIAGALFATSMTAALHAQSRPAPTLRVVADTNVVQEVQLVDGTKLVGRIVRLEDDRISFRTLGGLSIELRRPDVESIREIRGVRRGDEFWPDDPSDSRLFVGPTARVPGHGRGYFGVYELVVPSFGVGVGDRAMISGGMSVVPGIDLDDQVYYFSPKAQVFNTEYVQGAVGAIIVSTPGFEGSAGMVFGGVTAGDQIASFSGGLAFPFASQGGFEDQPLILLGGEVRASRGLKFITENWVLPGEGTAVSFGVRVIGSRVTVEAAAVTSNGGGFLPIVNFSIAW